MALRIPPGRAGRLWLSGRIETARRAGELLEQKRHVLVAAERAAAERADAAAVSWRERAAEAARWLERSQLAHAERTLEVARAHVAGPAEVHVAWRMVMGIPVPGPTAVDLPPATDPALLPGGVAVVLACAAQRRALEAAAEVAAANRAHDRLAKELAATVRRLRAIESRWVPLHEQALAALELALDEGDRSEGARIRWAARQRPASRRQGTDG